MGLLRTDEGKSAEHQLVHDHSKRVHVLLTAEILKAGGGFGRSVGEGPAWGVDELAIGSARRGRVLAGSVVVVCLSEIDDLDEEILDHHDVIRGEIEVSDGVVVEEANGIGEVSEDVQLG